jgi:hypothetical protein
MQMRQPQCTGARHKSGGVNQGMARRGQCRGMEEGQSRPIPLTGPAAAAWGAVCPGREDMAAGISPGALTWYVYHGTITASRTCRTAVAMAVMGTGWMWMQRARFGQRAKNFLPSASRRGSGTFHRLYCHRCACVYVYHGALFASTWRLWDFRFLIFFFLKGREEGHAAHWMPENWEGGVGGGKGMK